MEVRAELWDNLLHVLRSLTNWQEVITQWKVRRVFASSWLKKTPTVWVGEGVGEGVGGIVERGKCHGITLEA